MVQKEDKKDPPDKFSGVNIRRLTHSSCMSKARVSAGPRRRLLQDALTPCIRHRTCRHV